MNQELKILNLLWKIKIFYNKNNSRASKMKFAVENGNLRKQMERMGLIKNLKGTIQEKPLKLKK